MKEPMKKLTLLLMGIALVAGGCSANSGKQPVGTSAESQGNDIKEQAADADVQETTVDAETDIEAADDGTVAPDFTLNDLNGQPLKLSSLRGRYVVIDFWGSWCGWCIKGIPKMKEYYAKYKEKMEILGVDCNDSEEKWKAAVSQYQLPWLHVYCTRKSTVLADYAVRGFPTKVIVDPEGKIVRTVIGEDPAFYELLDELLK